MALFLILMKTLPIKHGIIWNNRMIALGSERNFLVAGMVGKDENSGHI